MPKIKDEVIDLKPAPSGDVVFPEVDAVLMQEGSTNGPITVEFAKQILGWEEETDAVKFGPDYLLTDVNDLKIRCKNNTRNRPINVAWCMTLAQELLMGRWRLNGETIVVGKTGEVLSGQHRLVAVILAEQMRQKDEYWLTNWPDEVTMPAVVVLGIDEADEVVNTLDTGKARTFSDVLYRSELLSKYAAKDRKLMSKVLDYAVATLWKRTGARNDAYAPERTHSEGMDFLHRHKKVLACAKHIVDENSNKSLTAMIPMGAATGICYLMGASESDPKKYAKNRSDAGLNFKRMDDAQDFFAMLASGSPELNLVRTAIAELSDAETGKSGTVPEKVAIVIKAWNNHAEGKKITPSTLKLEYVTDVNGNAELINAPLLGGIDIGDATKGEEEDAAAGEELTAEEIAKRAKEVRENTAKANMDAPEATNDELDALRAKHPDHVIWFEGPKDYTLYGRDADLANKHIGCKFGPMKGGLKTVKFSKSSYQPAMTALNEAGHEVAIARKDAAGKTTVERMKSIVKAKKPAKK